MFKKTETQATQYNLAVISLLLLARIMGHYCFAGWRPSSSSVTLPGDDCARRASRVTSR